MITFLSIINFTADSNGKTASSENYDGAIAIPTKPTIIKGVDIVQEVKVFLTNEQQSFEWKGYGLKLNIPPNSLPNDVDSCVITIKASLAGQYQFPTNTELVSPVFWLQCNPICKFKVPLSLEIGHCAPLKNSFRLFMARAVCTQSELPYIFKALHGSSFSTHSPYGVINLERFSGMAVIQERSDERRYWSSVFYMGPANKRKVHFTITWEDDVHITVSWRCMLMVQVVWTTTVEPPLSGQSGFRQCP